MRVSGERPLASRAREAGAVEDKSNPDLDCKDFTTASIVCIQYAYYALY